MKICPKCGAEMADDALVCAVCGYSTEAAPAPAPAAAPVNAAPVYSAPAYAAPAAPVTPAVQLKTNRGLIKFILLSIITFGIYGLVVYCKLSTEINITASKYDGKKTMHFALVCFLLGPITFEIVTIVWMHKLCARTGAELKRRGINYSFGAGSFWGWGVLGSLIAVGPFIFMHKLLKSFNLINADYNVKG